MPLRQAVSSCLKMITHERRMPYAAPAGQRPPEGHDRRPKHLQPPRRQLPRPGKRHHARLHPPAAEDRHPDRQRDLGRPELPPAAARRCRAGRDARRRHPARLRCLPERRARGTPRRGRNGARLRQHPHGPHRTQGEPRPAHGHPPARHLHIRAQRQRRDPLRHARAPLPLHEEGPPGPHARRPAPRPRQGRCARRDSHEEHAAHAGGVRPHPAAPRGRGEAHPRHGPRAPTDEPARRHRARAPRAHRRARLSARAQGR